MVNIVVDIPDKKYARLKYYAKKSKRTVNDIIRLALREFVSQDAYDINTARKDFKSGKSVSWRGLRRN